MTCQQCGACCIAPSITSPMPGMPNGKPAGLRCLHLTPDNLCALFGSDQRPSFCHGWQPSAEVCGHSFEQALTHIAHLEDMTRTGSGD